MKFSKIWNLIFSKGFYNIWNLIFSKRFWNFSRKLWSFIKHIKFFWKVSVFLVKVYSVKTTPTTWNEGLFHQTSSAISKSAQKLNCHQRLLHSHLNVYWISNASSTTINPNDTTIQKPTWIKRMAIMLILKESILEPIKFIAINMQCISLHPTTTTTWIIRILKPHRWYRWHRSCRPLFLHRCSFMVAYAFFVCSTIFV